jgi:hypothetical protein
MRETVFGFVVQLNRVGDEHLRAGVERGSDAATGPRSRPQYGLA